MGTLDPNDRRRCPDCGEWFWATDDEKHVRKVNGYEDSYTVSVLCGDCS